MTDDDKGSPIGENVRRNVEDLRKDRKLGLPALSARLGDLGRPMLPSVLHRQSQGNRRVDADDLVALSIALGVNPNALLFPRDVGWEDTVELTPQVRQNAYAVWRWAQGLVPLPPGPDEPDTPFARAADFAEHALPQGGEIQADPALREAYNLSGRIEVALQDFANPSNWDRRRDGLERAYRMVGLQIEELIARGDRETEKHGLSGTGTLTGGPATQERSGNFPDLKTDPLDPFGERGGR